VFSEREGDEDDATMIKESGKRKNLKEL